MSTNLKIGLWIPPRESQNDKMDVDNPANIDVAICNRFYKYLDELGVEYYSNLDFRKAIIKNHQIFIGDFCLNDLDHFIWMGDIDRHLDSYHLEVFESSGVKRKRS